MKHDVACFFMLHPPPTYPTSTHIPHSHPSTVAYDILPSPPTSHHPTPLSSLFRQALVRVVTAALNAAKALASRALFDPPPTAAASAGTSRTIRRAGRSLASKQMLLGNALCALYYSIKVWIWDWIWICDLVSGDLVSNYTSLRFYKCNTGISIYAINSLDPMIQLPSLSILAPPYADMPTHGLQSVTPLYSSPPACPPITLLRTGLRPSRGLPLQVCSRPRDPTV